MSYHIYQTEGFILSSIPVDEANRYISIYTKDLGLIRAVAQGVRNNSSKLKHSLQDLSFSKVSFVRGREIWRIVNAENIELSNNLEPLKIKTMAGFSYFFRRFVGQEEEDLALFSELKNAFFFLKEEDLESEDIYRFELIFRLRILNRLGYGPFESQFCRFFKEELWNKEFISISTDEENRIVSHINKAIGHSHL